MSANRILKTAYLLLGMALCAPSLARAVPVSPATIPLITFVNAAGLPCAACRLYTYAAGTTTPLATYTDATGTSTNTNPIILDASGGAHLWLGANSYKFILKDPFGSTIWSVDQVNAATFTTCGSAGVVQIANTSANSLNCDPTISINTTNHTLNIGTLPTAHVSIGALGTPTSWTFDTTTPATALASLGGGAGSGTVSPGTSGQLAGYAATGSTVSGFDSIPSAITASTQSPDDNSTKIATTAYVAHPGGIDPTSLQIAAGASMTGNQGTGLLIQHSTGAFTNGACAEFDVTGNVVASGGVCAVVVTPKTCNSNGCYRIDGDGTITEWGSAPGISGGGTEAVSFPTPFTSTTHLHVVTGTGNGAGNILTKASSIGTTGFTAGIAGVVFVGGSGSSPTGAESIEWIAIGD